MRFIYTLVLYLILPFIPLRLFWRSRKNSAYRHRIAERFALYNFKPLNSSIWIHAVSVGEVISAIPLVNELIKKYPNTAIVFTTMTPTGAERINKILGTRVLQLYVPYDYPILIKKFLRQINPKIFVIMETELWPNILHYTTQRKIPIILANARLSEKSFNGYRKVSAITKPMLDSLTAIAAQSKIDANRFLALGCDPKKVTIAGNIKFDLVVSAAILKQSEQLRAKLDSSLLIWTAGSTHQGEEEKILAAAKKIHQVFPNSLLILVPRHPERFQEVYQLCQTSFNTIKYSQLSTPKNPEVLVGDIMGSLLLFYAISDVAFVGGSLIKWGGHNLLEPAALAKPVISGPNLSAFTAVSQLLTDAAALIKVADENELAAKVIQLFKDKNLREKYGTAALDVVEQHRGATQKILQIIAKFIC